MKLFIASDIHGSEFYCRKLIGAYKREEADKMLREEFGNERLIFGGVPDLLTAAKTLWQMKRKNNSIFC